MIAEVLALLLLCLGLLHVYWILSRNTGNAPSFYSFPIFGHLPYLLKYEGKGLYVACLEWTKIFGPIFRIDLGSQGNIIINDYKLIKEALAIPELCGKTLVPAIALRMGNDGKRRGIVSNSGVGWMEQRKFTMRTLNDLGLGKSSILESIILEECMELIKNFRKDIGKPIITNQGRFNPAVVNVLWTIVAGHKFEHNDPKLEQLVKCVTQNVSEAGFALFFMPTIAKLFPNLSGWKDYVESYNITHEFMEKFVRERLRSFKDGVINDFVDAYIFEIKNTKNPESSFYKEEGIKNLLTTLEDLFAAGGETTSTSLTWILLCLSIHPNIQEKLHLEIDTVIGRERQPSLKDRSNMPYSEAVISEVLRMCTLVPLNIPHSASEDVKFNGITIPKDSIICTNIYMAHHDKDHWGDPKIFRPERFLSSDLRTVLKHEAFFPFSTGKRLCPGEYLARSELFLITICLYQAFQIFPDPNSPNPSLVGQCNGIISVTRPHKLIFMER